MIWATVSPRQVLFLLTVKSFSIFGCKNIINVISVLIIWWCPRVESFLELWKRVFAMTNVFSWQNSVSFCPASFCTPRPNLPVSPGISWLPTFALLSPMMKRKSFLGVSSRSLVGLHRTVQLQLLWHQWLGHRFGLLWCWMVCLGNEQRSFCRFWDFIQVLQFRLFCWPWWLLHFF